MNWSISLQEEEENFDEDMLEHVKENIKPSNEYPKVV